MAKQDSNVREVAELVSHHKALGESFIDANGVEWVTIKEAVKRTKQKRRNIELWIAGDKNTKPKVPGRQMGSGGRRPWYIDIDALTSFLRQRFAEKHGIDLSAVPDNFLELEGVSQSSGSDNLPTLSAVWEEQQDLVRELGAALERAGRMEGENKHLKERLDEKNQEIERLRVEIEKRGSDASAKVDDLEVRLTAQMDALVADRKALEERTRLQAENDQLRAEIESLKSDLPKVIDLTDDDPEVVTARRRNPIARFFLGDD